MTTDIDELLKRLDVSIVNAFGVQNYNRQNELIEYSAAIRELQAERDSAHERARGDAAKIADEHFARIKNYSPDMKMGYLVSQGYGNAALNIGCAIRAMKPVKG
jgi:hypothetical protein